MKVRITEPTWEGAIELDEPGESQRWIEYDLGIWIGVQRSGFEGKYQLASRRLMLWDTKDPFIEICLVPACIPEWVEFDPGIIIT